MGKKIVLDGYIVVPDHDLASVEAALPEHITLTRQEAGCVEFEVDRDMGRHNVFHVHEVFVDMAAFEAHQARNRASTWGQVSRSAERHFTVKECDQA